MRTWVKITLWVLFLGSVATLLAMVQKHEDMALVGKPEIRIKMDGNDPFLNENEILQRLERARLIYEGQTSENLDVAAIENLLRSISHVRKVRVFQGFNGSWNIEITLRKAIARIYNQFDETYYIDDKGNKMAITPVHSAHVLVISGHIRDRIKDENVPEIINNDSLISIRKLDDIYRISNYVCTDTLFRSLIGQVYLEKNGDFVLVPIVGGQKIIFGSAYTEREVSEKFGKLRTFYEEAMPFEGWNKYSEINLKFRDQIVCKTVEEQQEEN